LEEAIVANYPLQSDKVKHLIISKGMLVQSESYISFLKRLVEFDMSLSIKASAMKALFKHDIALISSYASSKDTKIGKAYKEVVDFYL
jgi:F0F1-type ATP synthase epsilon subunit